ncbi:MAG: energy-coupling factor transporter transmembrane protein EcfT [Bifidobacteriaceae bacterium]|nr:energy-coupling factor transporter transmembrane protein EcfT [Bifidobacteriaceae bacterium]
MQPNVQIHPGAWWFWALALAGGASQTTNPLLLVLIASVTLTVAVVCRPATPWALTLRFYVLLAVIVVVIRVGFRVVFGAAGGGAGPVALDLPAWRLPGGALVLLGPVTWDGLYLGLRDGLRLASLMLAVGAANVLASPKRVLAALPGALRQVGTAVVVTLTVFPALALSLRRVRRAARLRAPTQSRHNSILRIVFPVLADALDRSLELAASLESRGYGSTSRNVSTGGRVLRAGIACVALLLSAAGALALTGSQPGRGWVLLVAACVLGVGLLRILGRDVRTTRLRREPWGGIEWAVVASALAAVGGLAVSIPLTSAEVLNPGALVWPPLPWPAVAGLFLAAAPAWALRWQRGAAPGTTVQWAGLPA